MTGQARGIIAVLAALVPLLGACGLESGSTSQPHKAPTAAAEGKHRAPDPTVNAPGPQEDPGQCNERGQRELELQAHWLSETDRVPQVNWTHNGVSTPATNLRSHKNDRRGYGGEWSTLVTVNCHDVVSVNVKGTPSMFSAICAVIDLGQDVVKTGERDCAAPYKVP